MNIQALCTKSPANQSACATTHYTVTTHTNTYMHTQRTVEDKQTYNQISHRGAHIRNQMYTQIN